uniref:Uncharacterized protein n=1 Tax=viral metagenome TaxID=1070528 RepID=A0A6M3K5D9_9ZZZZ
MPQVTSPGPVHEAGPSKRTQETLEFMQLGANIFQIGSQLAQGFAQYRFDRAKSNMEFRFKIAEARKMPWIEIMEADKEGMIKDLKELGNPDPEGTYQRLYDTPPSLEELGYLTRQGKTVEWAQGGALPGKGGLPDPISSTFGYLQSTSAQGQPDQVGQTLTAETFGPSGEKAAPPAKTTQQVQQKPRTSYGSPFDVFEEIYQEVLGEGLSPGDQRFWNEVRLRSYDPTREGYEEYPEVPNWDAAFKQYSRLKLTGKATGPEEAEWLRGQQKERINRAEPSKAPVVTVSPDVHKMANVGEVTAGTLETANKFVFTEDVKKLSVPGAVYQSLKKSNFVNMDERAFYEYQQKNNPNVPAEMKSATYGQFYKWFASEGNWSTLGEFVIPSAATMSLSGGRQNTVQDKFNDASSSYDVDDKTTTDNKVRQAVTIGTPNMGWNKWKESIRSMSREQQEDLQLRSWGYDEVELSKTKNRGERQKVLQVIDSAIAQSFDPKAVNVAESRARIRESDARAAYNEEMTEMMRFQRMVADEAYKAGPGEPTVPPELKKYASDLYASVSKEMPEIKMDANGVPIITDPNVQRDYKMLEWLASFIKGVKVQTITSYMDRAFFLLQWALGPKIRGPIGPSGGVPAEGGGAEDTAFEQLGF